MALVADPTDPADIAEALAVRVAMLAAAQADDLVGRRSSRAAFRRWGEKLPADLAPAGDVAILLERHRDTWLRGAESFARDIDPGLRVGGVAVADYEQLGIVSPAGCAFVFPAGIADVVRDRLPAGAAPRHLIAINLVAHAETVAARVDEDDEDTLAAAVQFSVDATIAHEVPHLAVNDHRGRRIPADVTYDEFRVAAAAPITPRPDSHDADWVRVFAHATHRGDQLRPARIWWNVFRDDVWPTCPRPGELLEALADELADTAAPLTAILRRPAPTAFTNLFDAPAAPAA